MRIVYPGNVVYETVDAIIRTRAVPLYFSIPRQSECSLCAGSDPFCPACNGENKVTTYYDIVVSGLVRWSPERSPRGDAMTPQPYGVEVEGQCQVVLPWSDSFHPEIRLPDGTVVYPMTDLTTFPAVVQDLYTACVASGLPFVVNEAQYIYIHQRSFQVTSVVQKGVPLNRIHLVCRQVDTPHIRPF